MLSITAISVTMADNYYKHDNYYAAEKPGEWMVGKAAKTLGLSGEITDQDWRRVVRGQDPRTGEQLVKNGVNGKHRAATDLTFSAPKSVSIAALVLGREDIIEAHRKAVDTTLRYVEKHGAQVRVTHKGQTKFVKTGNLLIPKFEHGQSRENDCQLHTHTPVMNLTRLRDGSWKAVSNEAFFDNKMLYGQMYRNELAANLKELGYRVESGTNGLFEIAGVDKAVRDAFSRRSTQINGIMDQFREKYPNANESKLREIATLGSRAAKDKTITLNTLRQSWNERLQALGKNKDELNKAIDESMHEKGKGSLTAPKAVLTACRIITEQESTFRKEELLRVAGQFSLGSARIANLERAANMLISSGEIIELKDGSFTTFEMARIERHTGQMMAEGKGKRPPIMTREEALKALKGRGLTQSQIDFNVHALTSKDMVIGVQGYAGVGKTFGLDTFRGILESCGYTVRGLAYTGKAADGITTKANIESSTIAKDPYQSSRTDWIIVDEAGMTGSRDMHAILKRAKAEGSRVLLIGDTEQLQAISAGRMFKDLIQHGMATVAMKQVVRQKDGTYKEIVQSIIGKRIADAFDKLHTAGKLHEIKDHHERLTAIAKDYTNRPDWRKSVVLTTKNSDMRELNAMIRAILQERGDIGQTNHATTIRTPVSMRPSEQRFAQSYEVGQHVFARKAGAGGMKAGAEGKIIEIDAGKHTIRVRDNNGMDRTIDLAKHGGDISVYEEQQDRFSERERIIFTKNDGKLKVRNGQTGEILKIDDNGRMIISLQDNSTRHVDPAKYQYLNHGDAVTTYKAQGMSQDNVIVNAPADGLQTYNAMYVQATRGKYDLQVYTDSTEKLNERVKIEQEKKSTLESRAEVKDDAKQAIKEPERQMTRNREIEMER